MFCANSDIQLYFFRKLIFFCFFGKRKNIIENSKRYSNNTEISLKKTEDSLIILIDDDGPGIDAQDRENAMRPFFRLETSRNKSTGGTGLGLSIANNIILSHGGKLELLSSPLGGLRVKLSMPL